MILVKEIWDFFLGVIWLLDVLGIFGKFICWLLAWLVEFAYRIVLINVLKL